MRGMVFWLAIGMLGIAAPAAAEMLTLSNCTDETPRFAAFDEDDPICSNPRGSTALPRCGTVTFDCRGRCKIQEDWNLKYTNFCAEAQILSGEQTYTKGGYMQPTSWSREAAISHWNRSCDCPRGDMQW